MSSLANTVLGEKVAILTKVISAEFAFFYLDYLLSSESRRATYKFA